jgi:hypothetical protein
VVHGGRSWLVPMNAVDQCAPPSVERTTASWTGPSPDCCSALSPNMTVPSGATAPCSANQ